MASHLPLQVLDGANGQRRQTPDRLSETVNPSERAALIMATTLRRIGEGTYGECFDCGEGIPAARLRALPFAVRCKDCEEAREAAELRERMTQRRGSPVLFVNMVN